MKRILYYSIIILLGFNSMANAQLLSTAELQKTKLYKSIDDALLEPDNVYRINLTKAGITELPPEIGALKNLQSINLTGNSLTTLPPEIGQLKNLQWLLLEKNDITILPAEISNLKNLMVIDLDFNSNLDAADAINKVSTLPALRDLSMNYVYLPTLPPAVGKLRMLMKLSLMKTGMTDMGKEIGLLINLTHLNVAFNVLSRIPEEIGELIKLEELELGGNQLKKLPEEIKELKSLRKLGLASAENVGDDFIKNPITDEEMRNIEGWLPNTEIVNVYK